MKDEDANKDRAPHKGVALRASEALTQAILDSALDAVLVMDHEGLLVEFNPAAEKIFGYARETVVGRSLAEVIIPERLRERHRQGLERYLATGEGPVMNRQIELPALRADGTEFPAELAIVAIPHSNPPLFTGFLRDVTARKHLEDSLHQRADALARADRQKDEFLAMLAHELRNPLGPLRDAAEILGVGNISTEETAYARRVIARQIGTMARMLDGLLDVSRLTEGRIELRRKTISLETLLTSAVSLVRADCAARRQRLTLNLPAEPVYLDGDASRLEQVFGNLVENASKYGGDDCCIDVSAEREATADPSAPFVRISVIDDGTGIAAELLPHIFDLFVQSSRTLDREHGGLGIGLTLARRLVQLHGGGIEAHSEGLGKGAEFVVRLPILAGPPPPQTAHHPPPAVTSETPCRILIVDDNVDSARTLAMLHSHRGHETRTVFTGPDAVTTAAAFLPNVILLDIGLPGMDGFEVARHLRAIPALEDALLVGMSGYGRKEDREEATLAGFDRYLVKPIDLEVLRQWIKDHATGSAPDR